MSQESSELELELTRQLVEAEQEADYYGRWIYMAEYIEGLREKLYKEQERSENTQLSHDG